MERLQDTGNITVRDLSFREFRLLGKHLRRHYVVSNWARSQIWEKRLLALSCLSIRRSFRPHGTTRLTLQGFSTNLIFDYFSKICRENPSSIKLWEGGLHEGQFAFLIISCWIVLRMRNVSDKSCTENLNTHFMFNDGFTKIVPFMRKCGKIWYGQRGHRRQYGACALYAVYLGLQTHTMNV
jgi:hypothetical protein